MSKMKKWMISVLVLALLGGCVYGAYELLKANREPAKVYAVKDLREESFDDYSEYFSGEVKMDRMQTVYLSSTQELTEILVSQGDTVKKGDPLIRFNTSLSQMELDRMKIEIQKSEDALEKAQKTYRRYFGQNYGIPPVAAFHSSAKDTTLAAGSFRSETSFSPARVVRTNFCMPVLVNTASVTNFTAAATVESGTEATMPVTESTVPDTAPVEPVAESTEAVSEPETEPTLPETEPTLPETEPEDSAPFPALTQTGGSGTPEDPALYVIDRAYSLTPEILQTLLGQQQSLDLVLANTEENQLDGLVTAAWGLTLVQGEEGWSLHFWNANPYLDRPLRPLDAEEPEDVFDDEEGEPDDFDEPFFPDEPFTPSGPSWEELQQIRKELEEEIRSLDLKLRKDRVKYRSMEAELGDGIVRAEYDGSILSINDPESALANGEPLLKLSGGGGYKIVCAVNELQTEKLAIGQSATVMSWYGDSYSAVVSEISEDPMSGYYGENQNLSYYPVTLEVDVSADLGEAYYVDVVMDGPEATSEGYYLYEAFVLTENGKSYVLIRGENDLLEKRFITTGRNMYGYMIEVLDGLSESDYIAFPYAKASMEGAKTDVAKVRDLMGY